MNYREVGCVQPYHYRRYRAEMLLPYWLPTVLAALCRKRYITHALRTLLDRRLRRKIRTRASDKQVHRLNDEEEDSRRDDTEGDKRVQRLTVGYGTTVQGKRESGEIWHFGNRCNKWREQVAHERIDN